MKIAAPLRVCFFYFLVGPHPHSLPSLTLRIVITGVLAKSRQCLRP
jgi:hypothetical protein